LDKADPELLRQFGAERFGIDLDDQAMGRIEAFVGTLELWNRRIRLTGERDDALLVRKHVADSLACLTVMPPEGPVLDLGSGAGFPGIVIACTRPDLDVTLLDSRQKAVSFLREVIRTAGLSRTQAIAMRAEDAARDEAIGGRQQAVTSRAIRMDVFLRLAVPLRAPAGLLVSMQTPSVGREEAARTGQAYGLTVDRVIDYRLPSGENRRLIVWR